MPKSCVPSNEKARESTPSHFTALRSVGRAPGLIEDTSMPPSYAAASTLPHGDRAMARGAWSKISDCVRRGGTFPRSYKSTCISVDNTAKRLPSSKMHAAAGRRNILNSRLTANSSSLTSRTNIRDELYASR